MRLLTLASAALAAAVSFSTGVQGHPTSSHVVHDKRDAGTITGDWVKGTRAHPEEALFLRIGLKQNNLERAEEFINSVAHPRSETYGMHWSPQKVVEMFSPSKEAFTETAQWLLDAGVDAVRISRTASRGWIKVKTTVGEAECLLDTEYFYYENGEGLVLMATESYSVPKDVQQHIDLVTPTIEFDPNGGATIRQRKIKRRDSMISSIGDLPAARVAADKDSLANCNELTTPACLRAIYGIPAEVEKVEGNSFGVVLYSPGHSYNQTDLNVFFSEFTSIPNDTAPIYAPILGGYLNNETGSGSRGESNLDLTISMSLTYPNNVTLFQVGDLDYVTPATANNFLDAIDGDYCTFEGGDDPLWDPTFPRPDPSSEYAWTEPVECGTRDPTHVISISFGLDEYYRPPAYLTRQCTEYLKLGLLGVTFIYASGDTGVAGVRGKCIREDGGLTPVSGTYGRFSPLFPASCPWITSVGGSSLPENGTVCTPQVVSTGLSPGGGFSNVFVRPEYQAKALESYFANHPPPYNSSRYNTSEVRGFPDLAVYAQHFPVAIDEVIWPIGGTSAAAPTFGAMISIVNGERIKAGKSPVGFINPVLYEHPEIFQDIVSGNNPGCGTEGFTAVEGWDPASGLGAPRFKVLRDVFLALP